MPLELKPCDFGLWRDLVSPLRKRPVGPLCLFLAARLAAPALAAVPAVPALAAALALLAASCEGTKGGLINAIHAFGAGAETLLTAATV